MTLRDAFESWYRTTINVTQAYPILKTSDGQYDGFIVQQQWKAFQAGANRKVLNIENHIAMSCGCGSVNFALLKSGGVECNKCGAITNMTWRQEMIAELIKRIEQQIDSLNERREIVKAISVGDSETVLITEMILLLMDCKAAIAKAHGVIYELAR